MTENLSVLPCRSRLLEQGYFFSHFGQTHGMVPLILKRVFTLHLGVTHILPVAVALILQINLLKVVESTKKGTPLLSTHKIFH